MLGGCKSVIDSTVFESVRELLNTIEAEEDVRVLFAVESGSRAWGFHSQDSDYDVRFVYVHRKNWYLSIEYDLKRDVIERPISNLIDLSGWDVRKALRLFAKANPPLIEWLSSQTIYKDEFGFRSKLVKLLPSYYEPRTCMYHYVHMAENNRRDYLEGPIVWIKKYLYVLRPVLAVRWIEQNRGPVPMAFDELLVTIQDQQELLAEIRNLVFKKVNGDELDRGPTIPTINNFLFSEMDRQSKIFIEKEVEPPNLMPLQEVFANTLGDVWDSTT
jgi:predicted nucleotidyltransferase